MAPFSAWNEIKEDNLILQVLPPCNFGEDGDFTIGFYFVIKINTLSVNQDREEFRFQIQVLQQISECSRFIHPICANGRNLAHVSDQFTLIFFFFFHLKKRISTR